MNLSKKSEYAILASLYLAEQPRGKLVKTDEIAERGKLPKSLLLKILNTLTKKGIVSSRPGSLGGFRLNKDPDQISLYDILVLFETSPFIACCLKNTHCKKAPSCVMGRAWHRVQEEIDAVFKKITLSSLTQKICEHTYSIPQCKKR
jgi:Rrf2 family protein